MSVWFLVFRGDASKEGWRGGQNGRKRVYHVFSLGQ